MTQAKFTLHDEQVELLSRCRQLGFRDRSAMVRAAIDELREHLKQQDLETSAELYSQQYQEDEDLQQLTTLAADGWPDGAD